jgi:photosystem II stability/assembly factor-like uncharacterized protein
MRAPSTRPLRPVLLPIVVLVVLATALGSSTSPAATSGTVVGATVPSAITLQDGCVASSARSFGAVTPGSSVITATGAGVCRYTFESSNSSSMLRMYQADRTTQAMVGRPTTWNWEQGGESTKDISHAGTGLILVQDPWAVNGHYWRSTDGGATFSVLTPGGGAMTLVAAASTTVAWRFGFGTAQRSTNMQAATPTWTPINTSDDGGGNVDALAADAIDANVAWATGYPGIYRTGDAGATDWTVSGPASCNNAMNIDATSATTAFVTGWGSVCRSTDSNVTWTTQTTGLPGDFAASVIKASPQTITTVWVGSFDGRIARSTNNATNWSVVTPLPVPAEVTAIDVVSDAEALVATREGLVFRTIDSGASWSRVRGPFLGPIYGLAAPSSAVLVGAVHAGGFSASTDGGTTWDIELDVTDAMRDVDAIDSGTLVASMNRGRALVSSDGGATSTWEDVGFGEDNVRGVAVVDDDSFIVVGDQGSIAVSEDGGATWTQRASGTAQDLWDVDVTSENVAIAVGASGTILRSTDGGWSWSVRSAAGSDLRRVDARSGAPVIAVGLGGAIRRSTDAGATWTAPASGTTGNLDSVAVTSDTTIFAATDGTLLKSTDGGASWTTSGIGGMGHVEALDPDTVWLSSSYVGGWQQWVNVSFDGGTTWENAWGNHDPDVTHMHAIDGGRIYFGGTGGKLRVTDPPGTISDYSGGAWGGAGSMFGACLQNLGGTASVASWTEDVSGTCVANDADSWYPVPTAPVKVAQMAAAGTGTVDVVWGFKSSSAQSPGAYSAGIVVEAIAPNA